MVKNQSKLIGDHPQEPSIFSKWLHCSDVPPTPTKLHRSLTPIDSLESNELTDWLARKLIDHHYEEQRIKKLIEKYSKLGFTEYAEQYRKLPRNENTKKGNATEIILIEYIQDSLGKKLYHSYKFRHNPNVDQSIKGDDVLLIDFEQNKMHEDSVKIFLGECKFRKTPSKTVVDDLIKSLSKDKLPLSFGFLVDELSRDSKFDSIVEVLENVIVSKIKGKGRLVYTGLLLSNSDTYDVVEKHLDSDNDQMLIISIGLADPVQLIAESFTKAYSLIENPKSI